MANVNEQQLLALTQPASILNNLNTYNHHGAHLNEDIQASITVLLCKMHAPNRPITEVRDACIDFMTNNNLPVPLQHGGIISGNCFFFFVFYYLNKIDSIIFCSKST